MFLCFIARTLDYQYSVESSKLLLGEALDRLAEIQRLEDEHARGEHGEMPR